MPVSQSPREIDLRGVALPPDAEILDGEAEPVAPAPQRLFSGQEDPAETPYARTGPDPTGSAGLWRALESL